MRLIRIVQLIAGVVVQTCLVLINSAPSSADTILADPAQMLQTADRVDFIKANRLEVEDSDIGPCLRSTPNNSATALYQHIGSSPSLLRSVTWRWKVERLQPSADIRDLAREDFGAKVMFVFGEPTVFNKDVPTIAYVWTNTPVPTGTVMQSKRYSSLYYIQLRGREDVERWQRETRDLERDFGKIFGHAPPPLRYIALFNDNDQTHEAVSAEFGPISLND